MDDAIYLRLGTIVLRDYCHDIYTVPRKGVLSSKTSPDSMVLRTCINNVDGTMTRCYF